MARRGAGVLPPVASALTTKQAALEVYGSIKRKSTDIDDERSDAALIRGRNRGRAMVEVG
jgi:hypothetical protein